MNELYGANVQMALMSQVFLPKICVGTSERFLSVAVCEKNQLTSYKQEKTGQVALDDPHSKLSLDLVLF